MPFRTYNGRKVWVDDSGEIDFSDSSEHKKSEAEKRFENPFYAKPRHKLSPQRFVDRLATSPEQKAYFIGKLRELQAKKKRS